MPSNDFPRLALACLGEAQVAVIEPDPSQLDKFLRDATPAVARAGVNRLPESPEREQGAALLGCPQLFQHLFPSDRRQVRCKPTLLAHVRLPLNNRPSHSATADRSTKR